MRRAVLIGFGLLAAAACSSERPENTEAAVFDLGGAQALLAQVQDAGGADGCFRDIELRRTETEQLQLADARPAPKRILLAVDSSGSMRARLGGQTKIDAAKDAASGFLARNAAIDVGLLVFGHRGDNSPAGKPQSCAGVEIALPPGPGGSAQAGAAVSRLVATGWTPLATAIARAGGALGTGLAPGEGVVLVISDGVETCGGDPVAAARALHEQGVRAVVDIIGFDVPAGERAALEAVARAGGGRYLEARTGVELANLVARNQAAESNFRARVSVREVNATARNSVERTNAIARAQMCVTNLKAREGMALTNLVARQAQGGGQQGGAEAARAALAKRHEAFDARLARYEAEVARAAEDANADVRAAADRSRDSID